MPEAIGFRQWQAAPKAYQFCLLRFDHGEVVLVESLAAHANLLQEGNGVPLTCRPGKMLPPCETQETEFASIAPRPIPGKGRGVVALRPIAAGETIERSVVIVIPAAEVALIGRTRLASYYYEWGDDSEEAAIALGCGSLYNHSYEPNARYEFREESDCLEFIALCDIAAGEEITINYNNLDEGGEGYDDPMPFDVR